MDEKILLWEITCPYCCGIADYPLSASSSVIRCQQCAKETSLLELRLFHPWVNPPPVNTGRVFDASWDGNLHEFVR